MPTQQNDFCPEMLSALNNANSILLCTHISPDGDAIGSMLAVGLALRGLGKNVALACGDPVPGQYRFLPGAAGIVTPDKLTGRAFDLALSLDAASPGRLGDCQTAFFAAPHTAQMDHHPDNPLYAQINVVDGSAPAAGCVVYRALAALNAPVTPDIAAALYCAISTDTGNFRFPSTTPEAFRIMADLLEAGLDLPNIARPIHALREEPCVRLLGRALNTLRLFGDGRCACMVLRRADYAAARALPEHNANIVNYALDMPGVRMAFLAEEMPEEGMVKASLRAAEAPCNVAQIAWKYGGGGHALAAGLRLRGNLDELCAAIERDMLQALEDDQ